MDRQRRNDLNAAASSIADTAAEGVAVGLVVLCGRRLLEDPLDLTLDGGARLVERLLPVELLEGVHLAVVGGGDVRVGNLKYEGDKRTVGDGCVIRDEGRLRDVTLSGRNCRSSCSFN